MNDSLQEIKQQIHEDRQQSKKDFGVRPNPEYYEEDDDPLNINQELTNPIDTLEWVLKLAKSPGVNQNDLIGFIQDKIINLTQNLSYGRNKNTLENPC